MTAFISDLGEKIYLDANIYIYAFEAVTPYQSIVRRLLDYVVLNKVEIVASQMVLAELLPKLVQEKKAQQITEYMDFLQNSHEVNLIPVHHTTIMESIRLRAAYGLKTVDAIHMATALENGCTTFISHDSAFMRVKEIAVFSLEDIS